jgi:hypothetical protein
LLKKPEKERDPSQLRDILAQIIIRLLLMKPVNVRYAVKILPFHRRKAELSAFRNPTACAVDNEIAFHDSGKCPKCGRELNLSSKELMKAKVTRVFTCPMHPEVALSKDGVCPKCSKAQ